VYRCVPVCAFCLALFLSPASSASSAIGFAHYSSAFQRREARLGIARGSKLRGVDGRFCRALAGTFAGNAIAILFSSVEDRSRHRNAAIVWLARRERIFRARVPGERLTFVRARVPCVFIIIGRLGARVCVCRVNRVSSCESCQRALIAFRRAVAA
jgi:hypothetical protein